MASGKSEVSIATNPDNVWKLIRDFGGVAEYMPGIDSCTVDGDVRTLQMMGIEIKEQLRELDDDTRRFSYSVVESPMDNLVSHEATVAVDAEGDGTHLTWTVDVTPDELLPLFQGAYDGGVKAMKKKFEG
jgi:carbon monoxide dehydrogenase subunit G